MEQQQIPDSDLAVELAPPPERRDQSSPEPIRIGWRPQFSLSTALALMSIVGVAIAVVVLWREVVTLRAENHHYRKELGQLSIDNPKGIYAMPLPPDDPTSNPHYVRRQRIYLPEGKTYKMYTRWETVPLRKTGETRVAWLERLHQGFGGGYHSIDAGEHTVDVEFRESPKRKGQYELISRIWGELPNVLSGTIPGMKDSGRYIDSDVNSSDQVELDSKGGLILLECRQYVPGDAKEWPGIVLWIEEGPPIPTGNTTETKTP